MLVVIHSDLYGVTFGIARRVTERWITVEMVFRPPHGSRLTVTFFSLPNDDDGVRTDFAFSAIVARYCDDPKASDGPLVELQIDHKLTHACNVGEIPKHLH